MGLRMLSELPHLGAAIDPKRWLRNEDPEVRAAARLLDLTRRGASDAKLTRGRGGGGGR
jgi:hypothetical protein